MSTAGNSLPTHGAGIHVLEATGLSTCGPVDGTSMFHGTAGLDAGAGDEFPICGNGNNPLPHGGRNDTLVMDAG